MKLCFVDRIQLLRDSESYLCSKNLKFIHQRVGQLCALRFDLSIMAIELLNSDTVTEYLISRGLLKSPLGVVVEELSGGVSNIVLSVSNSEVDMVLKQALPELKVATRWVADQRRAIVEARAILLYNSISPKNVPGLIDSDPQNFTLVLERAPRSSQVWKTELLSGIVEPKIGFTLGQILSSWHTMGRTDVVRNSFLEAELFDQLRVTPFYRVVSEKNHDLSHRIQELISDLENERSTIVHGDFSPKNILIDGDHDVYVLDFEVAHWGNPTFDLAFLIAHLLCKYHQSSREETCKDIVSLAASFLEGYSNSGSNQISDLLGWHTALIALARVEGQSPVNYLDVENQQRLQIETKSTLSRKNPVHVLDLFTKGS